MKTKNNTTDNELLNGYVDEMLKANCCDADYWRKGAGVVTRLSNGAYFNTGRSTIETSFCFGYDTDYSGHELNDAEAEREAFVSSATAFKDANLQSIDKELRQLKEGKDSFWGCDVYPVLVRREYCRQTAEINVFDIRWLRAYEMVDRNLQPMSEEDKAIVIEALTAEREKFSKRLDTYLKRYGTSKLHTWTYWRD